MSIVQLQVISFVLLIFSVAGGLAQAPPATVAPAFEVASVRTSGDCKHFSMSPPGSKLVNITNASMSFLISMAYKVGNDQIQKETGSGWIDSECYTISAKVGGEASVGNDELRRLLQDLLAQRFKLVLHHEVKMFSGFALVVAKDGPNLHASDGGASTGHVSGTGLQAHNIPIASLATMLGHAAGGHIIDKTGLQGQYDITLDFSPDTSMTGSDLPGPSVFTALEKQVGLKLEPQKIPVDVLVIDHLEKAPTEN